jgi:transposase
MPRGIGSSGIGACTIASHLRHEQAGRMWRTTSKRPGYTGIVQADAYSGFNGLFVEGRQPGPIVEAAYWAHSRRKFFELARLRKMPIAIEAVRRIDELFAIERDIAGQSPDRRLAVRRERSKPLVDSFETWLRGERKKLSSKGPLAKAVDYTFNH